MDKSENSINQRKIDVIGELDYLQYIGPFPQGIWALLVPLDTAFAEIQYLDKNYTKAKLKAELKANDILVFNTVEDWAKFKGLKQKR